MLYPGRRLQARSGSMSADKTRRVDGHDETRPSPVPRRFGFGARLPQGGVEVASSGGQVIWEGGVLLVLIDSDTWTLGAFGWVRCTGCGRRGVVVFGLRMRSRLRCSRGAGSSGGVLLGGVMLGACRWGCARRSWMTRSARW